MKDLISRTAAGIAYVGIITCAIIFNQYLFFLLFMILMFLACNEFYNLSHISPVSKYIGFLSCGWMYTVSYMIAAHDYSFVLMSGIIPLVLFLFIYQVFTVQFSLQKIYPVFFTLIYIGIPLSLIHPLTFPSAGTYNREIILGVLILMWSNDTFAYMVGTLIGKHQLHPSISPKKTWEGTLGGILLTGFVSTGLWYLMGDLQLKHWIIMGLIVAIMGTMGDLAESSIKRNFGVKDTGNCLPGHGGVLDRIDSMLFAIPVLFVYLEIALG